MILIRCHLRVKFYSFEEERHAIHPMDEKS